MAVVIVTGIRDRVRRRLKSILKLLFGDRVSMISFTLSEFRVEDVNKITISDTETDTDEVGKSEHC